MLQKKLARGNRVTIFLLCQENNTAPDNKRIQINPFMPMDSSTLTLWTDQFPVKGGVWLVFIITMV